MLRKRNVSIKNGAILCVVVTVILVILAIALFSTGNAVGGGICIFVSCFFVIPSIIYYNKQKKNKLANEQKEKREKALSEISDALINDLGIVCSNSIREKVKQDAIKYVYYLSEAEIEKQKQNPNYFDLFPPYSHFCCVNSSGSLLTIIHAILIYHYLNLSNYIEKVRMDNNILPVNEEVVKKKVFHLIEEHLTDNKDEPFDCNNEAFIEKLRQILNTSTYIATGEIKINRKEPKEEQGT